MRKHIFFLIAILILAAVLRLLWLDKIPHSINGDQIHYLLTAKSFFLTGKDISQTTSPLSILLFQYPVGELAQAELLSFLEMPTIGPFGFSLLGAFLPNAILGILTVLMIYLITRKLLNEQIALFSSFIAAINPWFIFIGRTSYEMIPATFFYLCSFYLLLILKGWRILLALPFFMLAFYSYIATKLILLPLALLFALYCYLFVHKKKFAKQYIILLGILTLFAFFFVFQLKQAPDASRLSEITILAPNAADQVNTIRKTSIDTPLLSLFENKFTVSFYTLLDNVSNVFSPKYLFLHGDYFASLGKYGLFYPLDLVFLLIGGGVLFAKNKKLLTLLTFLILISIIPEIVHSSTTENFTPHITLLFPFFIIIMGVGGSQIYNIFKTKKQYPITVITSLAYAFFIGSFLNIYFFQMPLQSGFFNLSNRLLSQYIALSQQPNQKIIIYTSDPEGKFKEYIFYNNLLTKQNASNIAAGLKTQRHTIDNVTFLSCNKSIKKVNKNDLVIAQAQCDMSFPNPKVAIAQLSDSGGVFRIYNDTTCKKYSLSNYISGIKINDFGVGKLSEQQFCQKLIISQ